MKRFLQRVDWPAVLSLLGLALVGVIAMFMGSGASLW